MKILTLSAVILSVATLYAFKGDTVKGNGKVVSETRQTGSFDKISVAGNFDIVLSQGNEENAIIETDENIQSVIITEVKNNNLQIHVKEDTQISPTKLAIKVNLKNLKSIDAGGSGNVETQGTLRAEDFEISQGGSGDFDLDLNVSKLKLNMAGSGDFELSGNASQLIISAAGSGDVNAQKLKTENATVSMAGSGDVVLAKGVKAKVSSAGSGEVSYE